MPRGRRLLRAGGVVPSSPLAYGRDQHVSCIVKLASPGYYMLEVFATQPEEPSFGRVERALSVSR